MSIDIKTINIDSVYTKPKPTEHPEITNEKMNPESKFIINVNLLYYFWSGIMRRVHLLKRTSGPYWRPAFL